MFRPQGTGKLTFLEVLGPFPGRNSISGRIWPETADFEKIWIDRNFDFYLPLEGFVKIGLRALPGVQNVLKYTILVEISGRLELLLFRGVEISVENFCKKILFHRTRVAEHFMSLRFVRMTNIFWSQAPVAYFTLKSQLWIWLLSFILHFESSS